MGLFNFSKRKESATTQTKRYDFFAFSLDDLNEDIVSKMPPGLLTDSSVDVSVNFNSGVLVCMYRGVPIGYAGSNAMSVYNSHAHQNPILHSRSITGGNGKPYRLKLRFKYYE